MNISLTVIANIVQWGTAHTDIENKNAVFKKIYSIDKSSIINGTMFEIEHHSLPNYHEKIN
jgi:hypothetical protein